jgi:lipopolysaccharide cholinephosphotransferase
MTTRKVETVYPKSKVELGVEIDLFPLDNFDNNIEIAKQESGRIQSYMSKLGYTKASKPLTKNPLKFAAWSVILAYHKLLGGKHYVKKIIKECCKEEQQNSSYVGAKAWCIWGERGIIPAEVFSETIELEFEGEKFFAPKGYDTYLTCMYGDYLPEPPPEKRKSHHLFTAYRL